MLVIINDRFILMIPPLHFLHEGTDGFPRGSSAWNARGATSAVRVGRDFHGQIPY